jgi:LDH2 family malate/lactate/ureidoglycolate dehydrogenase
MVPVVITARPPHGDVPTVDVPLADLEAFCLQATLALGFAPDDAAAMTAGLVAASLRSLPGQGQGVQALAKYAERVERGVIDPAARIEEVGGRGMVRLLDAHRAAGGIAGTRAMERAVALAAEHGAGLVGVRDSTHLGAIAHYAELALPHGCIGLAFTNAGPEIAPWGGTRATVGTNPWAVAVPSGQGWPVVLDMANSTSGKGMMAWHERAGIAMPDDWALTADGARTTDPIAGIAGTLFPLGGAKGYAMALMVDALTGVLTGSAFGLDCFGDAHQDVGHLLLAIDIAAFTPIEDFVARMDALIAQVRASPTVSPEVAVRVPGELEHERREQRRTHGVPIPPDRFDELLVLGHRLGLDAATLRPFQEAR